MKALLGLGRRVFRLPWAAASPALLHLCLQCRAKTEDHGKRGWGALGLCNIGEFARNTSIVEAVFPVITRSQRMKITNLFYTGRLCSGGHRWPEGWLSKLSASFSFRSVHCLPLFCLQCRTGGRLWRLLSTAGFEKLLYQLKCDHCIPSGKNTGVGYHFLLKGTFPTQGSNPGLPHWRQTL